MRESQRQLPFESPQEQQRQERVARILGTVKQVETASAMTFTPENHSKAEKLAKGSSHG